MSQIPNNQGAVKVSEVQTDVAQNTFGTLDREDGLTLVTQIRNVCAALLRKSSFLLISDGVITWDGTKVANNGNNILLKINQNPGNGTVTVTIPTSVISGFTLSNQQILFFKCSRNDLASSFTASGSNLQVTSEPSFPAANSTQTDSAVDPVLYVPLLARYDVGSDQSVWWVPHGIYWPQNTTSVVGSIITGTTLPNGVFMPLHVPGAGTYPLGTPGLLTSNPGWALCDGAVIVNLQSSFNNTGRNTDGFPNATYSSANDRFAPTMNGTAPAWVTATSYIRGDAVTDAGATKLWVALSAFTSGSGSGWDPNSANPPTWSSLTSYTTGQFVILTETNINGSGQPATIIFRALANNGPTATTPFNQGTGVWQRVWATDPTQNGNPFKRSGFNSAPINPPNTFVRGSYTSPSNSSAYAGENSNGHTHDLQNHTHDLQNHVHSMQGHSHGGSSLNTLIYPQPGVGIIFTTHAGGFTGATFGGGSNFVNGVGIGTTGSGTSGATSITGSTGGPSTSNTGAPNVNSTGVPTTNSTGTPTDTENQPRYKNAVYIFKIY